MNLNKAIQLGLCLLVVACGSSQNVVDLEGNDPNASTSQQALAIPLGRTVPCTSSGEILIQNSLSLLVMDAYAACTKSLSFSTIDRVGNRWVEFADLPSRAAYHDALNIYQNWPGFNPNAHSVFRTWRDAREAEPGGDQPFQNCSVDGGTVGFSRESFSFGDSLSDDSFSGISASTGTLELCVAQRLRELSPGASGTEAILFTEDEQRQLLARVRDHAQQAMLEFALLYSGAATERPPGDAPELTSIEDLRSRYPTQVVPYIQRWVHPNPTIGDPEVDAAVTEFARQVRDDFAAAVQLHVQVTRELAELFARSRSARATVRSSRDGTRADLLWGPESWQQRLMVLMYGGDPLVNQEDGAWRHAAALSFRENLQFMFQSPEDPLNTASGFVTPSVSGFAGWQTKENFPYLSINIDEPQVWRFLSLARQHGVLELDANPDGSLIFDAADILYDKVSVALCGDAPGCNISRVGESNVLWRRHRITLRHVETAVEVLRQVLGTSLAPIDSQADWAAPLFNLTGEAAVEPQQISFSDNFSFFPKSLEQLAPQFTINTSVFLADAFRLAPTEPADVNRFVEPLYQGFWSDGSLGGVTHISPEQFFPTSTGRVAESRRRVGAISALVLTRYLMLNAARSFEQVTQSERMQILFDTATVRQILDVIDGAIGPQGFVLTPNVHPAGTGHPAQLFPLPGTSAGMDQSLRVVTVTEDPEDPFWSVPAGEKIYVVASAARDGSLLAANPGTPERPTRINGRDITDLVREAWDQRIEELEPFPVPGLPTVWESSGVPSERGVLLDSSGSPQRVTFFLMRSTPDELASIVNCDCPMEPAPWANAQFKLLAGDLPLRGRGQLNDWIWDQRALAYGGTLGNFVSRQTTVNLTNPSEPRWDGFGLPQDWVPPTDPELLALDGQNSTRYFLELARRSAEQAAAAVDRAFQNLVEETEDQVALLGGQDRATLLLRQESESLCGADNVDCTLQTTTMRLRSDWYPSLDGYAPDDNCAVVISTVRQAVNEGGDATNAGTSKAYLKCIVDELVATLLAQEVSVAEPVRRALNEQVSTVPTFAEYQGGQFQAALIEQFRAIRAPDERFALLLASMEAAQQRVDTAAEIASSASNEVERECGPMAVIDGAMSTLRSGVQGASDGAAAGGAIACAPGAFIGGALGGLFGAFSASNEARERCEEAQEGLAIARKQEMGQFLDSVAAFRAAAVGTVESMAEITNSGASLHLLQNQSSLATARHELELELLERGQTTSFGLVRRYRAFDLWRAKALIENARRYALAARRSIEARFVVDLSTLTQPEPFVQSPATWADEVYEYDLSLPAAVGLQVGVDQGDGIFANKIVDYVNNLEAFIAGYSVDRPSAAGIEDVDVVTLPGLVPGAPEILDDGTVAYAEKGSWTLFCPNLDEWVPATGFPDPRAVCTNWDSCAINCDPGDVECGQEHCPYVAPSRARLTFSMDPWGRMNRDITAPPFEDRYNARWSRLAVNFVGTGVRDCEQADDSLGCYAEGFIRYDLSHRGAAWITDFGGAWRGMLLPTARIEAGKGIAAELWLDPLRDGWNTSYIAPVARTELRDRPFGGEYELVFDTPPEVRIDRIERVQIMQGSEYWVAQEF